MNGEASPRPWRADEYDASLIRDADGRFVARADSADAALIVDAVNGRPALAAVLRDMEEDREAAWEGTPLRRALAKYAARLCEIAGKGETPTGKGVGE